MKLSPLREMKFRHAREEVEYSIEVYNPWEFCEYVNKEQPQFATRFIVNIGAHDGKSYDDPCYPLFQRGYAGVAIEGTGNPDLAKNLPSPDVQKLTSCMVTPDNVCQLLESTRTPKDFDFLKVDIDGYDGPIVEAILRGGYRPKLMQLEINPEIPPPLEFSVMFHPNYRGQEANGLYTGFYGMSLSYAFRIAERYGYHLIYMDNVTPATHDVVFARNELSEVLGTDSEMNHDNVRQRYLSHPLPGWFHFEECGFDSLGWRYRTDFTNLATEIWNACLRCSLAKHGQPMPFYFTLSS